MYRKARVALAALRDLRPRQVVPITLPTGGNSAPVRQFAPRPCKVLLTAGPHDTARTKQFSIGVPWPYSRCLTLFSAVFLPGPWRCRLTHRRCSHRLSHFMFDYNYSQMTYCMYDNYSPKGQRTASSTGLP